MTRWSTAPQVGAGPTASWLATVDVLALGLLASGVGKGDRVGIWAPNVPEWTQVQYATAKIGAILVNINPAYRVHELEYVLTQVRRARRWLRYPSSRRPITRR